MIRTWAHASCQLLVCQSPVPLLVKGHKTHQWSTLNPFVRNESCWLNHSLMISVHAFAQAGSGWQQKKMVYPTGLHPRDAMQHRCVPAPAYVAVGWCLPSTVSVLGSTTANRIAPHGMDTAMASLTRPPRYGCAMELQRLGLYPSDWVAFGC